MSRAALTRSYDCRLIVNDRVDIALACEADGVHLGQEDLPLHAARKLMGDKIIGISTHDVEQAREAERGGADYIGFGPMFGTTTKETGYSARGLEMLRQVREAVRFPSSPSAALPKPTSPKSGKPAPIPQPSSATF